MAATPVQPHTADDPISRLQSLLTGVAPATLDFRTVFWMERFLDPQLFPNDLIADYFQSVAPTGYSALYNLMAHLGVHPMLLNKLLPMALGFITTAYCFLLCLRILPVPGAAFFSTLILNQSIWMQDDLVSATPRAFLYPLFLAFLYYLVKDAQI